MRNLFENRLLLGFAAIVTGAATVVAIASIAASASSPEPAVTEGDAEVLEGAALSSGLGLANQVGNAEQRSAFDDGRITADEYAAAISATLNCLSNAGFEISDVGPDWSGTAYDYGVTGPDGAEEDYQECYQANAIGIDMAFQLSFEQERQKLIESTVLCLNGGEPDLGVDLVETMIVAENENHDVFKACVDKAKSDSNTGISLPQIDIADLEG